VSADLTAAGPTLESAFGDMQDFEFTVEEGQLFFLQARAGTRTPWAAVRIAADLVRAGVIAPAEALRRLAPYDLDTIVRTTIRPRPAACLVGCSDLRVDASARACSIGSRLFREGDVVTLDAVTGCVYEGEISAITERPADALAVIDSLRTHTN
jgi:pyruvate,orthophosphate dikinase